MANLVNLYEKDFAKLVESLEASSVKELCIGWEQSVRNKPSIAGRHLNALLKGYSSVSDNDGLSRYEVFVCAVKQLQLGEISVKHASEILGILMLDVTMLPMEYVVKVMSFVVDSISNGNYPAGKWLELLPHLLSIISAGGTVHLLDKRKLSGLEYQSHILNELCSINWPTNYIASMAAMFKDVNLSHNEMELVLNKMLCLFDAMEYNNIPPLVYQLLDLSSKGHRQLVFQELVKFFNAEDVKVNADIKENPNLKNDESLEPQLRVSESRRDELRQCQGTVLLHIMFAVKHDLNLGNEFLKFLKLRRLLPDKILTPFTLSLSLCIATDHQFQQPIFDCVKAAVMNSYKEQTAYETSTWIRSVLSWNVKLDEVIKSTVKNSSGTWDHVLHGLIEFGFMLLDIYGSSKPAIGKIGKELILFRRPMCKLGSDILFTIFKENRAMRVTISEHILNHILPTESASMKHYLDLLSKTVQASPQAYLENGGKKVREVFFYLDSLPEFVATTLLRALQPLLKVSSSLRDAVLLFLRKTMFLRELNKRKIAVSGLLLCLTNFKSMGTFTASQGLQILSQGSISYSQSSVDVQVHSNSRTSEALCLEVVGVLRRSLSQQADVRITLYLGLPKVIQKSPNLTDAVLDLLLHQANQYIEPGAMPPLRLLRCVQMQGDDSQPSLVEPLAHLVRCIHHCLEIAYSQRRKEIEDSEQSEMPWTHPLAVILEELIKAFVKTELEDLELDVSEDYSMATSAGQKNNILATQVLGVCEALIECFYITSNTFDSSMAENILALFGIYSSLVHVIKEKSSSAASRKDDRTPNDDDPPATANNAEKPVKANKKKDKMSSKVKKISHKAMSSICHSLLSEPFVVTIFRDFLFDNEPEHQEALSLLRQNEAFEMYLIKVAIGKIPTSEETSVLDDDEMFELCCSLGKLLLHRYSNSDGKDVSSQILVKIIEGFATIVSIICDHFAHKLEIFLGKLVRDRRNRSQLSGEKNRLIVYLDKSIKRLQEMIDATFERFIADDDLTSNYAKKELVSLLQALALLVSKLPHDSQFFIESLNWIDNFIKKEPVEDNAVAKNIVILLLLMKRQQTSSLMVTLKELVHDFHLHLKDVDKSIKLEGRKHIRVISLSVVPSVTIVVIDELISNLADVQWVLDVLKARMMTGDRPGVSFNERRVKENSICRCLASISFILVELLESALPAGPCVESLLRFTTKYYTTMTEIVKYFTSVLCLKNGSLSERLEKLVKLVNAEVTQKVYPFITYIQQEPEKKSVSKTKTKRGKASAEVAQANKEARLIPPLIYNLEQYERFLIQLAQKSKVDLTSKMKMNTNRDFRISLRRIPTQDDDNNDEEKGEENDEQEDGQEDEGTVTTASGSRSNSPAVPINDDDDGSDAEEASRHARKRKKCDKSTPEKILLSSKEARKRIRLTTKSPTIF